MRRNTSSKKSKLKFQNIKCDGCARQFNNTNHFEKHIHSSNRCRIASGFCCDFCKYIGYDNIGLRRHLQHSKQCCYFYNEKKVLTGQLLDKSELISVCKNPSINTTSYSCSRFSANGIEDSLQINYKDETADRRQVFLDNTLNGQKSLSLFEKSELEKDYRTAALMHGDEFWGNCDLRQHASSESMDSSNIGTEIDDDSISSNTNSDNNKYDIRGTQDYLAKRMSNLSVNCLDEFQLDLFHILKASNAPLILYDRIITLMKNHENTIKKHGTNSLMKRNSLITDLKERLYGSDINMNPRVQNLNLSSGRQTNIVTFSIKDMILRMVSNKSLFNPSNLLLDPDNPLSPPKDTLYYGDVNTGSWHKEAIANECGSNPKHILMPFCHFIDGLAVDKYGKINVEAVLTCCLWFNRKARNRSSTWWVQGFVENQSLFTEQKHYIKTDRVQDYHDMMSCIFKEMRDIRDTGGIQLTLDFGNNNVHDVTAIPVIQFIIGDCKGNDLLCGRKGGHTLEMNGLCRDCDISPHEGDNLCIGSQLKCKFHTKDSIVEANAEKLESYSFFQLRNCFSELSFGGCNRNIYGGSPAEILHAVLLGLCVYIAESINLTFTDKGIFEMSTTTAGICNDCRRQSERDIPCLAHFTKGLNKVKSLKAKDRFGRVFCVYLSLMNSYLISDLCKLKKRKHDDIDNTPLITTHFLRGYFGMIENTLMFHLWLKKDQFLKTDFVVANGEVDSIAMQRIKSYLSIFKSFVVRGGNNLKTPKFHSMLHIVDYIKRHGCPMNYDGSRGENIGKTKIKDNAKRTNQQKHTLHYDIGKRISECDIVDHVSTSFFERKGRWPSQYCSDSDLVMGGSELMNDRNIKPRFTLTCDYCENYDYSDIPNEVNININWGGITRSPLLNFSSVLVNNLAYRLFFGVGNIGGKLMPRSIVNGYTEYRKDGYLYRSHPCYAQSGEWYDWGYFQWTGIDKPIPGRMMMIFDLSDCEIDNTPDIDPDLHETLDHVASFQHLTREKWVVLCPADAPEANNNDITDRHFQSSLATRIKLHDDNDLWMVPLSTLVGPCFVVCNKDYNGDQSTDRTAYVVKPMTKWADEFIPIV